MAASNLPIDFMVGGDFFTYALPWLLTFAIVWGFLQHYKIPESSSARAVISIVMAFFVMPAAAPVVSFLQQIGASLIVVVTGIIFFLVLLELTRTKRGAERGVKKGDEERRINIVEAHPKTFGIIVAVIIGLIFWGSGGFEAMGLNNVLPTVNWPTLFFLGILTLVIWWLVSEERRH